MLIGGRRFLPRTQSLQPLLQLNLLLRQPLHLRLLLAITLRQSLDIFVGFFEYCQVGGLLSVLVPHGQLFFELVVALLQLGASFLLQLVVHLPSARSVAVGTGGAPASAVSRVVVRLQLRSCRWRRGGNIHGHRRSASNSHSYSNSSCYSQSYCS